MWNGVLAHTLHADDVALYLTVLSELLTAKLHVHKLEPLPTQSVPPAHPHLLMEPEGCLLPFNHFKYLLIVKR